MSNIITKRREPFQFMLYLGMGGSALLFLMLSMIYLLRSPSANWESFSLPKEFWISTFVILLSSFTLHQSNLAIEREKFSSHKWLLGLSLAFGTGFILLQCMGWIQLYHQGVFLDKNVAGAFVYLISGIHLLHAAGGLIFMAISFVNAIRRTSYVDAFVYSVNPPNRLKLRLVTLYWHFVDAVWIILFLFFLYHHW